MSSRIPDRHKPKRQQVQIGAPDRALTASAGLAAVTELCGRLDVIEALDAAVGPVKQRDGWSETRRSGSHRVLARGDQQHVWAYHDGVDLSGPAMARISRDYGYTLAELRKL